MSKQSKTNTNLEHLKFIFVSSTFWAKIPKISHSVHEVPMSPSLALKAIYTTCQKLNLVPKGLLAFKPKCMIMTGPADRLSWSSTSVLVFGCWPI